MWKAPVLVSAIALSGCLANSDAELRSATNIWGDCVMAHVVQVDDGLSDPASEALGISSMCGDRYQAVIQAGLSGANYGAEPQIRAIADQNEMKAIVAAILIYRSANPAGKARLKAASQ